MVLSQLQWNYVVSIHRRRKRGGHQGHVPPLAIIILYCAPPSIYVQRIFERRGQRILYTRNATSPLCVANRVRPTEWQRIWRGHIVVCHLEGMRALYERGVVFVGGGRLSCWPMLLLQICQIMNSRTGTSHIHLENVKQLIVRKIFVWLFPQFRTLHEGGYS